MKADGRDKAKVAAESFVHLSGFLPLEVTFFQDKFSIYIFIKQSILGFI
jgi:hypothetical protein